MEEVSGLVFVVVQVSGQVRVPRLMLWSKLGGKAGEVGLRHRFKPVLDLVQPVRWFSISRFSDFSHHGYVLLPKVQIVKGVG